MRFFTGLGLVMAVGLAAGALAKPAPLAPITAGHLAPRDLCTGLPGASAFRGALAAAIRRRDADALAALAAGDVMLDFGGTTGPPELKRLLRGPGGAALWRELDALLALGCVVQDGDLVLPWFYGQDIGEDEDYQRYLVAGANVPLRQTPSGSAKVLRQLSWVLVRQLDAASEEPPRYTRVRLDGGPVTGYVETAKLRSQTGYRLAARREGKVWKIAFFLAGD